MEEIGVAQTGILNALQASRDKLKVALDELSNRRKSLVCLPKVRRGCADHRLAPGTTWRIHETGEQASSLALC